MPRRRRPSRSAEPPPSGLLDWSSSEHWSWREAPCRYCDGPPTNLRDSHGKAAHKVCAETALAERADEARQAYEIERMTLPG